MFDSVTVTEAFFIGAVLGASILVLALNIRALM
jgi:hypothetical protein